MARNADTKPLNMTYNTRIPAKPHKILATLIKRRVLSSVNDKMFEATWEPIMPTRSKATTGSISKGREAILAKAHNTPPVTTIER